jgi:hypothetical protein
VAAGAFAAAVVVSAFTATLEDSANTAREAIAIIEIFFIMEHSFIVFNHN